MCLKYFKVEIFVQFNTFDPALYSECIVCEACVQHMALTPWQDLFPLYRQTSLQSLSVAATRGLVQPSHHYPDTDKTLVQTIIKEKLV